MYIYIYIYIYIHQRFIRRFIAATWTLVFKNLGWTEETPYKSLKTLTMQGISMNYSTQLFGRLRF